MIEMVEIRMFEILFKCVWNRDFEMGRKMVL